MVFLQTLISKIMRNITILFSVLFLFNNFNLLKSQNCTNVEELFRKRHTIQGMTYGHPYTTFDRHNENYKNLQNAINNIRNKIIEEKSSLGPIYTAYEAIYKNAKSDRPADNGLSITFSNGKVEKSYLAAWAKDNAFVFLIGLDSIGQYMDTTIYNGASVSAAKRNAFRDRAKDEAFSHLNDDIDHDNAGWGWVAGAAYLTGHSIGAALALYNLTNEQLYLNKLQFCSRSLILWLQTYDLLKAAYEIRDELDKIAPNRYPWGFADADRNGLDCSQRNKLRRLTRELYVRSNGILGITDHAFGWKKNHGIAAASAVLMAAQVLNDAGTETNYLNGFFGWLWGDGFVLPHPRYSPVKTII
jgi:hypothetical protein